MKIVQCSTCMYEYLAIESLQELWKTQEEFNNNYRVYQDAARKWECADYMGAWE